ncbi:MAG: AAA family ATPase [Tannerellaceae bacterium]|nr:AAA family ATPase [Tannerellaceae bacterium]
MNLYNHLYILTGGPGSGKTSVLNQLREKGYRCVDEGARRIIREEREWGGTALPWEDRSAYTARMLSASIRSYQEHQPANGICFFDRGIPDTYGYSRLVGLHEEEQIGKETLLYPYNEKVFLFPPWQAIYETDTERKQDFGEALRTYRVLKETYQSLGYTLIEVPETTIEERVQFILDAVK